MAGILIHILTDTSLFFSFLLFSFINLFSFLCSRLFIFVYLLHLFFIGFLSSFSSVSLLYLYVCRVLFVMFYFLCVCYFSLSSFYDFGFLFFPLCFLPFIIKYAPFISLSLYLLLILFLCLCIRVFVFAKFSSFSLFRQSFFRCIQRQQGRQLAFPSV
jgi:hypothetical protein